jgi:hypothetical protein
MALTGGRWWVEYELADQGGNVTRKRYELNSPADYDAAVVSEAAFRLDLIGVTDAVIKTYRVYREFYEAAFALPAAAQNENQALLVFQLYDNPLKTGVVAIPAAKEALFVGATGAANNILDVSDAAVVQFANNFLQSSVALLLLSDGEQAATLVKGHRRHVKKLLG